MCNEWIKLTVFFEDPFWVGVFERFEHGKLTAAKVTFGAEPKDREVYEFFLEHFYGLSFSPAVEAAAKELSDNPKKRQREIRRSLERPAAGTKSQQALKLQYEQNKLQHSKENRARKLEEADRKFDLKQQKKKEKHRGR